MVCETMRGVCSLELKEFMLGRIINSTNAVPPAGSQNLLYTLVSGMLEFRGSERPKVKFPKAGLLGFH